MQQLESMVKLPLVNSATRKLLPIPFLSAEEEAAIAAMGDHGLGLMLTYMHVGQDMSRNGILYAEQRFSEPLPQTAAMTAAWVTC